MANLEHKLPDIKADWARGGYSFEYWIDATGHDVRRHFSSASIITLIRHHLKEVIWAKATNAPEREKSSKGRMAKHGPMTRTRKRRRRSREPGAVNRPGRTT
jgi:hypothetical protein